MMVNMVISLLYMDDLSLNSSPGPPGGISELLNASVMEEAHVIDNEDGNKMVISFTGKLLDILRQNLQPMTPGKDNLVETTLSTGCK